MDARVDEDTTELPSTTKAALRTLLEEHGATIDNDALVIESLAVVLLLEDIELRLGVRVPARLVTTSALSSWTALCRLVAQCEAMGSR